MRARRDAVIRGALLALCCAATAATVLALVLGGGEVAVGLVGSVLVGSILIVRVPENRVGAVLLALGASGVVADAADAVLRHWGQGSFPDGLSAHAVAVAGASVFPLIGTMGCTLFLIFPTGRARGRWRWMLRALLVVGALGVALGAAWAVTRPAAVAAAEIVGAADSANPAEMAAAATFMIGFPMSLLSLTFRYRAAGHSERLQIRWLLLAAALLFTASVSANVVGRYDGIFAVVNTIAFLLFPVAIGIAVTRHRLYEIDRLVNRAAVYTSVVAILAAVFAAITVLPTVVAGTADPPPLVIAASTLTVAAAFNPLRRRVQRLADRRFHRSRYDPDRVADDLAARLRDHVDPIGVARHWIGVSVETLQPAAAGIWIRGRDQ